MKRVYYLLSLVFLFVDVGIGFAQTALPVSRTSWSAAPAGWTDNYGGNTYTSLLACDGNSNRAKFSNSGEGTNVFFSGVPGALSFDLQGNTIGATSSLLVEESPDGSTWNTVATISGIASSCVTYTYTLTCTSTYVRWTYTKVSGNLALDNVSIAIGTCGGGSTTYPVLTGIVVDGCNTYASTPACGSTFDNSNCSEGRSEIAFFRAGSTAITAAQVQGMTRHVIDYYTTAWSTLTYYTGISMNNAAATTALNSSGCSSGSCGTCFKDAWSNGIPANATFIMLADYYCIGSTDYTNLCSNSGTNPIYVIYFGASTNNSTNCNGGTTGVWDVSGNYTNYSGTPTVKGIAIDFSSLVAGSPTQYYTYDINSLVNCSGATDGAGIAFGGVSTNTASPATPDAYTSCQCNLTIVLPVNLLSFTAAKINENTQLNWATDSETNSDYFLVEYSLDGQNFISYKEIKSVGNSTQIKNYSCLFTLDPENQKTFYFRLKQVDNNGNYKYSNIITLTNNETTEVKSYYNAGTEKIVNRFYLDSAKDVNVILYDVRGNKMTEMNAQFNTGENEILINAPETAGVYFLVFSMADNMPVHKKIMISK
jgi:hypothetical protein